MDNLAIIIAMLIFYAGLAFALFLKVKSKKHQSRNTIKSFLFVLGVILGAILITSIIIWLIISSTNIQKGGLATAFGVGAILLSVIRAWLWSFSKIETAINSYQFEVPATTYPSNMIPKDQYLSKYSANEKKLMAAISIGKIKSSIESGELFIEDKKY